MVTPDKRPQPQMSREEREQLWLRGELRVLEHWALAIGHAASHRAGRVEPGRQTYDVAEVCLTFGERLAALRARIEEDADRSSVSSVRRALHGELAWIELTREKALAQVARADASEQRRVEEGAFALLEMRDELHSMIEEVLLPRS